MSWCLIITSSFIINLVLKARMRALIFQPSYGFPMDDLFMTFPLDYFYWPYYIHIHHIMFLILCRDFTLQFHKSYLPFKINWHFFPKHQLSYLVLPSDLKIISTPSNSNTYTSNLVRKFHLTSKALHIPSLVTWVSFPSFTVGTLFQSIESCKIFVNKEDMK